MGTRISELPPSDTLTGQEQLILSQEIAAVLTSVKSTVDEIGEFYTSDDDFVLNLANNLTFLTEIAANVAYGDSYADTFTATAAQTDFPLTADPGILANLDVSVDGSTKVNGVDFTYSGTTLIFLEPMVGGEVVLAKYNEALPTGVTNASSVFVTRLGTGAVQRTVEDVVREELSILDFGAVGDGVTDDTDALVLAIQAAVDEGLPLYFPPGTYMIDFVDEIVTSSLAITLAPGAIIKGSVSGQVWAGTGAIMAVTITDFDFYAEGVNVETVTPAGVVTQLDETTDYTLVGNLLTTVAAVDAADELRVASRKAVMSLRAQPTLSGSDTPTISWTGGMFDTSLRGYSLARASGSALTLFDFRFPVVTGASFVAGPDYTTSSSTGFGGDSGLTFTRCIGAHVSGCYFQGHADLGIYHTGGAGTPDPGDNGGALMANGNIFYRCSTGLKAVRETPGALIVGNYFIECATGVRGGAVEDFGVVPPGTDYIIADNFFKRTERRCIDVREMPSGCTITGNRMVDWGYDFNDVVTTFGTEQPAIFLSGCPRSIVMGNYLEFRDWDGTDFRGVHINSSVTVVIDPTAISVRDNCFVNIGDGIVESGGAGNFNGCRYIDNRMIDVTNPYTIQGANTRWHYIQEDGVEIGGIGNVTGGRPYGTWTPTLTNQGNISASSTYVGQYMRVGNVVTVSGKVDITPTANSTNTELRLSLPIAPVFTAEEQAVGICNPGTFTSAGDPGSITALNTGGANLARLRFLSGAASAGVSRAWYYHFTYQVP